MIMKFKVVLLFMALVLICVSNVSAQNVVTKTKPTGTLRPGERVIGYKYDLSYSRNESPNIFEMDYGNLSLAKKDLRIRQLKNWSNSITGNNWKLHTIEVIRKPDISRSGSSNGNYNDYPLDYADDYAETLTKILGETDDVYERARILRNWAIRNAGKLNEQQFDIIINAIQAYNRMLDEVRLGQFAYAFRYYRTMPRIPRTVIKAQVKYYIWAQNRTKFQWVAVYDNRATAQRVLNLLESRYRSYGYRFGIYEYRR